MDEDQLHRLTDQMNGARQAVLSLSRLFDEWYALADDIIPSTFSEADKMTVYRKELGYRTISVGSAHLVGVLRELADKAGRVSEIVNMLTPDPLPLPPNTLKLEKIFRIWVRNAEKHYKKGVRDASGRNRGYTGREINGSGEVGGEVPKPQG